MSASYPIYFDYNSTTPCDPEVVDAILPYFTQHFGNASSKSHAYGWMAEDAVEHSRIQVAELIHAQESEIIFTSGATESINLALRGIAELEKERKHIITVSTEHKAVLDVCRFLEQKGFELTVLPVMSNGQLDLELLERSIRKDTLFIAAMLSNNETGVVFPVAAIGQIAASHGVCFFCDATQAFGKLPIDVRVTPVDMMAFSGHKIYGPKGVGGLYIKKKSPKINLQSMQLGGGQEKNLRSGTINVPGIVGLGKASELARKSMENDAVRLGKLKSIFLAGLEIIPGLVVHGDQGSCQSHVLNLGFGFEGGDKLLKSITKQVAVSSGSACSSALVEPSHVLKAMGISEEMALASIRFSFGRMTTSEEVSKALHIVKDACFKIIDKQRA